MEEMLNDITVQQQFFDNLSRIKKEQRKAAGYTEGDVNHVIKNIFVEDWIED